MAGDRGALKSNPSPTGHPGNVDMPKVPTRRPADPRSRVDRIHDRIRNNRVAAIAIVLAAGVGALASFTDSVRKLGDALPTISDTSVAGQWKSEAAEFYPGTGPEYLRLYLQEAGPGQVVGLVQFGGGAASRRRSFSIIDGRRDGKAVTLSFDSGSGLHESVSGNLASGALHLVYRNERSAAVAVTMGRIEQSTQLVQGHLAILYKGKEYAAPAAACARMLSELDPPQTLRLAEPPDDWGNVHCVGQLPGGAQGFDMRQNDVQQWVICPAGSRVALVNGFGSERPRQAMACECDGTRLASGNRCAAAR